MNGLLPINTYFPELDQYVKDDQEKKQKQAAAAAAQQQQQYAQALAARGGGGGLYGATAAQGAQSSMMQNQLLNQGANRMAQATGLSKPPAPAAPDIKKRVEAFRAEAKGDMTKDELVTLAEKYGLSNLIPLIERNAATRDQEQVKQSREEVKFATQQALAANELQSYQDDRTTASNEIRERAESRVALIRAVDQSQVEPSLKATLSEAINAGAYDGKGDKLVDILNKKDTNRFMNAGGNSIFDTATQKFINPPGSRGPSTLDQEKYVPETWTEYVRKFEMAATEEERALAGEGLILRQPGWRHESRPGWDGVPVLTRIPVGDNVDEVREKFNAANAAGANAYSKAVNTIRVIDSVRDDLANNRSAEGLAGKILSQLAGTKTYDTETGLETIRSNLGLNALQEARAASVDGSSGFGQLTEKELNLLVSNIASLNIGMSKEQLDENLRVIRETFEKALTAKGTPDNPYTWDEWLRPLPLSGTVPQSTSQPVNVGRYTIIPQ